MKFNQAKIWIRYILSIVTLRKVSTHKVPLIKNPGDSYSFTHSGKKEFLFMNCPECKGRKKKNGEKCSKCKGTQLIVKKCYVGEEMRIRYSKREIVWKKKTKRIPDKCTIKQLLGILNLGPKNYDVAVNGVGKRLNYIIKEGDELVLLQRPLSTR